MLAVCLIFSIFLKGFVSVNLNYGSCSYFWSIYFHKIGCVSSSTWNYDTYGPSYWFSLYSACGGYWQSPLNINTTLTYYDRTLVPIQFNNYNTSVTWNFTSNGYSGIIYFLSLYLSLCLSFYEFTHHKLSWYLCHSRMAPALTFLIWVVAISVATTIWLK